MLKRLAPVFTAALVAATPAAADQPLQPLADIFRAKMIEIGCDPLPERYPFEYGKSWEEQTIPMPEQRARSQLVWYCEKNQEIQQRLEAGASLRALIAEDPEQAILALRAVPEDQTEQRNRMARATAIEMARYTLDFAFADRLGNHPDLPRYYNELKSLVEQITPEQDGGSYADLERIHQRAYEIRLELDQRDFYPSFVYAAQAVAMAAAVGEPAYRSAAPNVAERDWAALEGAYTAMNYAIASRFDYGQREEARVLRQEKSRQFLTQGLAP